MGTIIKATDYCNDEFMHSETRSEYLFVPFRKTIAWDSKNNVSTFHISEEIVKVEPGSVMESVAVPSSKIRGILKNKQRD